MEEFQQNLSKDEDNSLGVSNMGVNEDCILGHQMLWKALLWYLLQFMQLQG